MNPPAHENNPSQVMLIRYPWFRSLLACFGFFLLCFARGLAEPSSEVVLHARFVTEEGLEISDLKADEIRIYDGGRELEIVGLTGPAAPFHVGLLLDVSPSIEARIDEIRHSTQAFFYALREDEEGLIITFDSQIYLDCDWTTDRRKIDEAIFEFGLHKGGNSSAIYDALAVAIEQKLTGLGDRRALLVLSDGVEVGSEDTSQKESLQVLRQHGFPVFVVQFDASEHYRRLYQGPLPEDPTMQPPPGSTGGDVGGIFVGSGRPSSRDVADYKLKKTLARATGYLRLVAEAGRGRYYITTKSGDLTGIYNRITKELDHLYTLRIRSRKDRSSQRMYPLTVATTRTGVLGVLLTRGYWPN